MLDLRMRRMDGYEVSRHLSQELRAQRGPTIIITASDDPSLNGRDYAGGAQAGPTKPFRKEPLDTVIEAVLAGMAQSKAPSA